MDPDIARAQEPVALAVPHVSVPRIGYMRGEFVVPVQFDTLGADEIAELFDGA